MENNLKQRVIDFLKENYPEEAIISRISAAIKDFVDPEWEDDGHETEEEWYEEFCNGEAQDTVRSEMVNEIINSLQITEEQYEKETEEELYQTLIEYSDKLDS